MVQCARHKFDYLFNRDAIELSFKFGRFTETRK